MVRRVGPVNAASSVSTLDTEVRRNRYMTTQNGLDVLVAETGLLDTARRHARDRPLGRRAARAAAGRRARARWRRSGSASVDLDEGPVVTIGGVQFAVIGILDALPLHPDLDRSVFIGNEAAERFLGAEVIPTRIYLRADPDQFEAVRSVLGRTVNPTAPNEVDVSRPSDALEARARVDEGLRRLLLGLGAVALVVGGVGVANVMVISVLERRSEIGLRRALGATRRHVAGQFVVESATLTTGGGLLGIGDRRARHRLVRRSPGLATRRPARRAGLGSGDRARARASLPACIRPSGPHVSIRPTRSGRCERSRAAARDRSHKVRESPS